jgi:hypothetical protein
MPTMSLQLSWDLHIHPAPSTIPRWGDGAAIQAAAARAGVRGFVWKSHEMHTADLASALVPDPHAFGSASLNTFATTSSIRKAIADGARWVWGPTYRAGGVSWDLPLPAIWPEVATMLMTVDEPLVLATGHLGADGRRAFAQLAAQLPRARCSITHSLYLEDAEIDALRALDAVFEVDLYTATRAIEGRPLLDLAGGLVRLTARGAFVYLTTDAGQVATGDPYAFSAAVLQTLRGNLPDDVIKTVAIANPAKIAAHALGGADA